MSGFRQPTMRAGGNINKARFIMPSTSADKTALEATSGELPIGISSEGQRDAPIDGSDAYAAVAGRAFEWHGVGESCLLEIGSGGCNPGDLLMAGTGGVGIEATAGNFVGARALVGADSGELAEVQIMFMQLET